VLLQVQDLPTRIADLKEAGLCFRNEMEVGPAANRFKLKIPTAIRLSCSSLLAIDEPQAWQKPRAQTWQNSRAYHARSAVKASSRPKSPLFTAPSTKPLENQLLASQSLITALAQGGIGTVRTRFALCSCRLYAARKFTFFLFHEAFPICSISKELILHPVPTVLLFSLDLLYGLSVIINSYIGRPTSRNTGNTASRLRISRHLVGTDREHAGHVLGTDRS